jgi:hypothetical protein
MSIGDALDERRFKIVSIDQQMMLDVFNWWRKPPHWLALPVTDELPEDCYVVSVHTCWDRRTLEALVCSEQFEPVPECAVPPRIPGMVTEFRQVEIGQRDKHELD